jgi:hypothetical protein
MERTGIEPVTSGLQSRSRGEDVRVRTPGSAASGGGGTAKARPAYRRSARAARLSPGPSRASRCPRQDLNLRPAG